MQATRTLAVGRWRLQASGTMANPSLANEAMEALDRALQARDPLTRMMLMERALKLHRQAVQQDDDADDGPAYEFRRRDAAAPSDRRKAH